MSVFQESSIAVGNKFVARFSSSLSRLGSQSLLLSIGAYRTIGTAHFGGQCRFEPSCSDYAAEAVRKHSPGRAVRLIFSRLLKCRPGGPFGWDPVPGVNPNEDE